MTNRSVACYNGGKDWNGGRMRDNFRMLLSLRESTSARSTAESQSGLFDSLMRKSYRQAYTLAYRLCGNAAEAEDLVQDTYLRAFRFFHRYDQSMSFTSWLYRIMSNAHIDTVRRKGRLRTTSLDQSGQDGNTTWDVADEDASVDRALLDGTLEEPVQQALLAMTTEFRTAVLLADVEGLAYEEIAEIMKTSVGTVRSRIHRGRKQFRKHLLKLAPKTYRSYSNDV